MTRALIPRETAEGWIIIDTTEDHYQLGNRTYPTREACQQTIDRLDSSLPFLLMAAEDVIDRWENGNIAETVRDLKQILKRAWTGG